MMYGYFFFFKQKTAYEMRISDWSSDVCSSDLRMQVHKYVVHQVAHAYGKTATFMPKPIKDDNGSGMHTHFSIWEKGQPLFAGNEIGRASCRERVCQYV